MLENMNPQDALMALLKMNPVYEDAFALTVLMVQEYGVVQSRRSLRELNKEQLDAVLAEHGEDARGLLTLPRKVWSRRLRMMDRRVAGEMPGVLVLGLCIRLRLQSALMDAAVDTCGCEAPRWERREALEEGKPCCEWTRSAILIESMPDALIAACNSAEGPVEPVVEVDEDLLTNPEYAAWRHTVQQLVACSTGPGFSPRRRVQQAETADEGPGPDDDGSHDSFEYENEEWT